MCAFRYCIVLRIWTLCFAFQTLKSNPVGEICVNEGLRNKQLHRLFHNYSFVSLAPWHFTGPPWLFDGGTEHLYLYVRMWSSKVHQQAFFVLLRTMADHRYAAVCLESARISQLTNPKTGYLRHAAAYDPLSTFLCICHYAYGVHSIAFFTCSRSVSMTTIFFSFRQSSFLPRFMHLSLFFWLYMYIAYCDFKRCLAQ